MKFDATPIIDLFSILTIGMFVLFIASAGHDVTAEPTPNFTFVRVSLANDDAAGKPYTSILQLQPYYIKDGKPAAKKDLKFKIHELRSPDNLGIFILGLKEEISIGFKITAIYDKSYFNKAFTVTKLVSHNGKKASKRHDKIILGNWADPVVHLERPTS